MTMVSDIRMKGFQTRTSVQDFINLIDERVTLNGSETVKVTECYDRVLAETLYSPTDIPAFKRSAMDGYAVKGEETFGASTYNPINFRIVGQVTPGREFLETVRSGETVQIMTGAPMPKGADAVLLAEYSETTGELMQALEAVAPGKNVGTIGEDIKQGECIFSEGRRIRPQDAAVIASVGIDKVPVIKQPQVDLIITGNEILKPGKKPEGVNIVDSNSVILRHCIDRDGGRVAGIKHLQDDKDVLRREILNSDADMLCITGGTSVGVEDIAPVLVRELGQLLVHGVSIRPASPTGFGIIDGKPVFLLPGNPVSCLSAYDFFVSRVIKIMGGRDLSWPYQKTSLQLATNISSQIGRVDYVRVQIRDGQALLITSSGAAILSSTTKADGFIVVPAESEGYREGGAVNVWLYDN